MIKTTIGELFGFDDAEIIELQEDEDSSEKDKENDYKQNQI